MAGAQEEVKILISYESDFSNLQKSGQAAEEVGNKSKGAKEKADGFAESMNNTDKASKKLGGALGLLNPQLQSQARNLGDVADAAEYMAENFAAVPGPVALAAAAIVGLGLASKKAIDSVIEENKIATAEHQKELSLRLGLTKEATKQEVALEAQKKLDKLKEDDQYYDAWVGLLDKIKNVSVDNAGDTAKQMVAKWASFFTLGGVNPIAIAVQHWAQSDELESAAFTAGQKILDGIRAAEEEAVKQAAKDTDKGSQEFIDAAVNAEIKKNNQVKTARQKAEAEKKKEQEKVNAQLTKDNAAVDAAAVKDEREGTLATIKAGKERQAATEKQIAKTAELQKQASANKKAQMDLEAAQTAEAGDIMLRSAEQVAGGITAITNQAGEESIAAAILNKAVASANIIYSTYQGAAKAIAIGGPFAIPIAASIIAGGLGMEAQVLSTPIPSHHSGKIPGGATESTAKVQGNETIFNANATNRIVQALMTGRGGGGNVTIQKVGHRTTDMHMQQNIRRTNSPTAAAMEEVAWGIQLNQKG